MHRFMEDFQRSRDIALTCVRSEWEKKLVIGKNERSQILLDIIIIMSWLRFSFDISSVFVQVQEMLLFRNNYNWDMFDVWACVLCA